MKKTILVDLGIITEYLKTGKGVLPTAYEKYSMEITSATYAELLASVTFKDEGLEKEVLEFIDKYFEVIPVTKEHGMGAAKMLRENSKLNFATALLGAVAKVDDHELLTHRPEVFDGMDGVKVLEMDAE